MNCSKKEENYFKNRLEDQIQWYSNKSSHYKKLFYIIRAAEIIIAGLIPALFHWSLIKNVIPLLSAIVANIGWPYSSF